jgi:hydroxyacylglutathione hydrolase
VSLKIINIDTPTLGDRSYLVHDGKTALVVDPQRDIDRVEDLLIKEGVSLGAVVETHMHNDYVSGGLVLAQEYGVKYIVHEQDPVTFERTTVKDQEIIAISNFAIQALHTPGHTFTHLSYALMTDQDKYQAVFTGGSLLHGSTGRPDLLGPDHAATLARLQHGSANRLANLLEDSVSIHPTHGFGSFCAATLTSGDSSTIKDERQTNPALLFNVDDFVSQTLAGLDVFPAYYKHMGPANQAGAGPIDLSELPKMSSEEVIKAIASGSWVVDIRSRDKWVKQHVPGSLSFGVDGSFATYLGWLFPYDEKLYLISDKADEIKTAQRELVRIGIERPQAAYVGSLDEFEVLASTKAVTFADVVGALVNPEILVLDVRRNSEREASHIKGTSHIPLHELSKRVEELPKDKEIWVHCAGAYRAAAAVGILEKAGLNAVLINQPYEATLQVKQLPIVLGHADAGPVAPSDQKVTA